MGARWAQAVLLAAVRVQACAVCEPLSHVLVSPVHLAAPSPHPYRLSTAPAGNSPVTRVYMPWCQPRADFLTAGMFTLRARLSESGEAAVSCTPCLNSSMPTTGVFVEGGGVKHFLARII